MSVDRTNITALPLAEEKLATHLVFITDLIVDMMIGVYEHEKQASQPVRFNIEITALDHSGPINDDYHNVLCYETIATAISKLAKDEHINLVETLADKVMDICLSHDRAMKATVKVEKLNAISNAGSVGIQITRSKG